MRFQCPFCKGIVEIDDSLAGSKVQCGNCQQVTAAPENRLAPGAIVGDFVIKKELSRGGMGIVFRAHQLSLDRPAALKVLQDDNSDNDEFISGLIREARAAAKLIHPHIVQAYAVGQDGDLFYFAMEFIGGETMKNVLDREKVIDPRYAAEVIKQIAEALKCAWNEQKLVHHDIKPENILLTRTGQAKLSDLGIAQVAGDTVGDDSDEVMGTPQYISPEQLIGSPSDCRSDIYSLGATFFHFVTGRFAYVGADVLEITKQHVAGHLTPPKEINPALPDEINRIIVKMMQRDIDRRYQGPQELIDDLDDFLKGKTNAPAIAPASLGGGLSGAAKPLGGLNSVPAGSALPSGGALQGGPIGGNKIAAPGGHSHISIKKAPEPEKKPDIPGVSIAPPPGGSSLKIQTPAKPAEPEKKPESSQAPEKEFELPPEKIIAPAEKSQLPKLLTILGIVAALGAVVLISQMSGEEEDLPPRNPTPPPAQTPPPAAPTTPAAAPVAPQTFVPPAQTEDPDVEESVEIPAGLVDYSLPQLPEDLTEATEAYRQTLPARMQAVMCNFMQLVTTGDYDGLEQMFQTIKNENPRLSEAGQPLVKAFKQLSRQLETALTQARKLDQVLTDSGTQLAGTQIQLSSNDVASIRSIENNVYRIKHRDGSESSHMRNEIPVNYFLPFAGRAATAIQMGDADFYFLLCNGEFGFIEDKIVPKSWKTLLPKLQTVYFQNAWSNAANDDVRQQLYVRYGNLPAFQQAIAAWQQQQQQLLQMQQQQQRMMGPGMMGPGMMGPPGGTMPPGAMPQGGR